MQNISGKEFYKKNLDPLHKMSLLPTANQGASGVDYFVRNVSTSGGTVIDTVGGVCAIEPNSLSVATIRPDVAANGTMYVGSSATTFSNLTLTTASTSVGNSLLATNGLTVTGTATFNNAINMTGTAPSLRVFTVVGVVTADGVPATLPQPGALPAGMYSIMTRMTGNRDRQVSTIAYWDGAVWGAGGATAALSTLGPGNSAIHPALDGASLIFVQSSGGAITIQNVYYAQLAAVFA